MRVTAAGRVRAGEHQPLTALHVSANLERYQNALKIMEQDSIVEVMIFKLPTKANCKIAQLKLQLQHCGWL